MSKSSKLSFPDNVGFTPEALNDFIELDHSFQIPVFKAICKVAENPQPRPKVYEDALKRIE